MGFTIDYKIAKFNLVNSLKCKKSINNGDSQGRTSWL